MRKPRCDSRSAVAGPTPKMKPTGRVASIARASSWSSTAKPRGLSRSEAILARNLLQDSPTDTVMPISRSTCRGEPRQHLGGDHAVQPLGAGQIEERLVDRQRLDQRRQRQHRVAHLAADPDVFRHVGPHHRGLRAQRQRLEHRHRRAHPIGAGDVAGRRHHAALAAADDHRAVGDLRIVALLDGGVERVAVDMRQRQRRQRAVPDQARRAAGAAAPRRAVEVGEAVAAEAVRSARRARVGHGTSRSDCVAQHLPRRRDRWSGRVRKRPQTPSRSRRRAARNPARWRGTPDRPRPERSVSGPSPVSARNRPSRSGSPAMKESA